MRKSSSTIRTVATLNSSLVATKGQGARMDEPRVLIFKTDSSMYFHWRASHWTPGGLVMEGRLSGRPSSRLAASAQLCVARRNDKFQQSHSRKDPVISFAFLARAQNGFCNGLNPPH